MDDSQPENESSKETEKILISIANPDTIEDMVNLSLVIRDPKLKDNLLALNVINDDNNSDNLRIRSKHYLEKAEMTATEANVPLKKVTRYDLNIASGIIHSVKENEITSIITGLHRKKNITDSYFGILAEHLLNGLNCEIIISKFLIPVHTIKRIVVAVPPKAEYESGFPHWMEHFCRMGSTLGCRVHFFANEKTTIRLQAWIKKRHKQTLTDFSLLEDWNDLLVLTGQVSYDHWLLSVHDQELFRMTVLLRSYRDSLGNISPTIASSCCILTSRESRWIRLSSPSYILIPKPDITRKSVNGFTGGLRKRDKIRIEVPFNL